MPMTRRLAPLMLAATLAGAAPASANETDQYLLPIDQPFADLGHFFDAAHYELLTRTADHLNDKLRSARSTNNRARIEELTSPGAVADAFRAQLRPGFIETLDIERALRTRAARSAHPGRYTIYRTPQWIYSGAHLVIDPRNIPLLVPSSTILVHGSYFGTDKIAHFHDLGHYYYKSYLARLAGGATPEEARDWVVWWYSRGPISETLVIGSLATGVVSNADLASNYVGMRFYENLTQPVVLKGAERPPLLILRDGYWRLNFHVRPESGYFEAYVSDHFNEALNPNVFEIGMRRSIKRKIRDVSDQILAFYADEDGEPRSREWFERTAVELRDYYGEDYGAFIKERVMFTIADVCMPTDEQFEAAEAADTDDEPTERDPEPSPEPTPPATSAEPRSGAEPDVVDVTPNAG